MALAKFRVHLGELTKVATAGLVVGRNFFSSWPFRGIPMTTTGDAMQWTPDEAGLAQLMHIFAGLLSPELAVRSEATAALTQATAISDFDNYLLHILLTDDGPGASGAPMSTRASAGLYLKNDLLRNWAAKPAPLKHHILTMLPHALINGSPQVRKYGAITIAAVFRKVGGPPHWPNLVPNLLQLLDGAAGADGQRGALEVLALITEDSCRLLDRACESGRPLEEIVPRLVSLLGSGPAPVQALAGRSLVHCVNIGAMVVQINLDALLETLYALCQKDCDPSVKIQMGALFCAVLEQWPQKLISSLQGIVQWCIHTIASSDDDDEGEKVALQCCEFLLSMVNAQMAPEIVVTLLEQMLPLLLSKMVYSAEDVILMENDDARDQLAQDRDEDVKPQMAKAKEHTVASAAKRATDDSDDEEDSDDDEDSYTWNIRKCSAATVDVVSCSFPVETLHVAFPIIKQSITSSDWPVRESAILTLGAISEAALEHANAQLPELVQFLMERVKDPQPRVRQIACWTLGRYSSWVCSQAQLNGDFANYFEPTFQTILNCALDQNKVVQESACSAIADFIENTDSAILVNLCEPILSHFQLYFQCYRRKNLVVLYDTVQTFVEKVGDTLQYQPQLMDLLLPPLITKWQSLEDHDKDLWPLLECMSSVAACLGEAFAPYAPPVYERAIRILQVCIEMDKMAVAQAGFDAPEKDFIVTSLDLIDGLIQGLSVNSIQLISHGDSQDRNYSLMELVITCLDDTSDDVRQSAYALLGDLAIHLADSMVKPYLQTIMMCINNEIGNPSDTAIAARNNAIWSLGEIAIKITHDEIAQYFQPMAQGVLGVVHNLSGEEDFTLRENAAITLGRFGVNSPSELVQMMAIGDAIAQWSEIMNMVMENEEKDSAFTGMANALAQNVDAVTASVNSTQALVQSIADYNAPGDHLASMLYQLLQSIKTRLGDSAWTQVVRASQSEGALRAKYGL